MSLNKKILGIIFANMHENVVPELTRQRTMGSVMFGGRYRLIDFTLSNMANSGVDEVGIITKSTTSHCSTTWAAAVSGIWQERTADFTCCLLSAT